MVMKKTILMVLLTISTLGLKGQQFGTLEVSLPYMFMQHSQLHAYGYGLAYVSPKLDKLQLVFRASAYHGSGLGTVFLEEGLIEIDQYVIGWWPHPEDQINKLHTSHSAQNNFDLGIRLNFMDHPKFTFNAETGISYMHLAQHYLISMERVPSSPFSDFVNYPLPYQVQFTRFTAFASAQFGYQVNKTVNLFFASRYYYLKQNNGSYVFELGASFGLN
jgi:hypothetical protein